MFSMRYTFKEAYDFLLFQENEDICRKKENKGESKEGDT